MGNLIITEKQLELLVNQIQEGSSSSEQQLNEDTWMNTAASVVGLFDPTGIVDFLNGVSYLYQGDYLFGVLSMISVFPYFGDVIAKPIMGSLKVAGKGVRFADDALRLAKAGKTTDAVKLLRQAGTKSDDIQRLINSSGKWGQKVIDTANAIPGSRMAPRAKKLVSDYVDLFRSAKATKQTVKIAGKVDDLIVKFPKLSKSQQVANLNQIRKAFADVKGFKSFELTNPGFIGTIAGGVPRFWGNRSVRSLMNRSKWYLGFLDFIGIGNFVGPDELDAQMGKGEVEDKLQEYSETDQSEKNWSEDFGTQESNPVSQAFSSSTSSTGIPKPTVGDLFGFFSSIAV
jgi:hypothetical protein